MNMIDTCNKEDKEVTPEPSYQSSLDEDDPARFMDIEMQSNPNPGSVYPSSDEEPEQTITEEVLQKKPID